MTDSLFRDPRRWRELASYQEIAGRARERCLRVAADEEVMGYEESWETYAKMSDEMVENYSWLCKVLP